MALQTRQLRGKAIAEKDSQVLRFDDCLYKVASQSGKGFYKITRSSKFGAEWICLCPDFTYRQVKCKHIWAVEFSLAVRNTVKENVVIPNISLTVCPNCGSKALIKRGLRHNRYGDLQRFLCKNCEKRFTQNYGFEKLQANPQAVTTAMQLYFSGESLRNVQKFLKLQGIAVSHVTVYKWIGKYVKLMDSYLSKITPQVSDTWRADELYLKVKGDMKYLFAVLDDETRFWIAREVADTKYAHDARQLFRAAKVVAGKKPKTLITDGLRTYQEAYTKEYWTRDTGDRTVHIRNIAFKNQHNNNKMERFNGEIRDREKIVRGVKKADSPLLKGYQIYHNYIRPHMGLDGQTPADKVGISVEGEDKWLTLIQNAADRKRGEPPKAENR
ncbi:MAG: DDE-type integrase/transposase/recombinase [Candidatus Bathyarchaeia archaeon]|jgi:transposase-like protein